MTGVDALRNGASCVFHARSVMNPEIPTIAEHFTAREYRTGHFGKWHLGDNYPHRPMDRGFQDTLYPPGAVAGWASDYRNNDYFDDTYLRNGVPEAQGGYCTDVWFREAMEWMETCRSNEEPFFCFLATNGDHLPLFVPDEYRDPYRHLGLRLASFFGMIANFDENLGRLEDYLRTSGLSEETIVVFLSDNGGTEGVHLYNAGMRGAKGQRPGAASAGRITAGISVG